MLFLNKLATKQMLVIGKPNLISTPQVYNIGCYIDTVDMEAQVNHITIVMPIVMPLLLCQPAPDELRTLSSNRNNSKRNEMNGALGHDSALIRLY